MLACIIYECDLFCLAAIHRCRTSAIVGCCLPTGVSSKERSPSATLLDHHNRSPGTRYEPWISIYAHSLRGKQRCRLHYCAIIVETRPQRGKRHVVHPSAPGVSVVAHPVSPSSHHPSKTRSSLPTTRREWTFGKLTAGPLTCFSTPSPTRARHWRACFRECHTRGVIRCGCSPQLQGGRIAWIGKSLAQSDAPANFSCRFFFDRYRSPTPGSARVMVAFS